MAEGLARDLDREDKREQKRSRFYGHEGSDGEEQPKFKKVRFPKGKKAKDGDGSKTAVDELGGPISSTDPRVAATERAVRRKGAAIKNAEDTDMLDDVAGAEEDFQGGDDDEKGEIEPFNLQKEREEGYFDAQGNYVEYKLEDDARDAWLDSAEVDPALAEKAAKQAAAQKESDAELSQADIAAMKRRIANSLQAGETILQALRRLGGGGTKREKRGPRGKAKGVAVGSREEHLTPGNKVLFDRLTEDAMQLMSNGETDVYSERQEAFLREAEGYEALARARAATSDMFGDEEPGAAQPSGSSAGSGARNGANAGGLGGAVNDDIFGDDEPAGAPPAAPAAEGGQAAASGRGGGQEGPASADTSGYVFDDASGLYYNSTLGYYYDATTGLYCNAESGVWYNYDETRDTYSEVKGG